MKWGGVTAQHARLMTPRNTPLRRVSKLIVVSTEGGREKKGVQTPMRRISHISKASTASVARVPPPLCCGESRQKKNIVPEDVTFHHPTININITGNHRKQDQILLVKVGKYIGFCEYRRSYLLCPPVIVSIRGTIVNRTKKLYSKHVNTYQVVFFLYTVDPTYSMRPVMAC